MKRLLTSWLAVLIVVTAAPRQADAQVYPERLVTAVKARGLEAARAYQRHSREDNREEQTEHTTKVVRLGPDGVLALGKISGDITISRAVGAETAIDVVKRARARAPA